MSTDPDEERVERGSATMRRLGIDPDSLRSALAPVDGGFAESVIAFAFGEIVSDDRLDLRTRQLVTVATLTAIGGCEPQLEAHVSASVRAGATRTEIIHAIIQTTPYAGIPRAINALNVVKKMLPTSESDSRHAHLRDRATSCPQLEAGLTAGPTPHAVTEEVTA